MLGVLGVAVAGSALTACSSGPARVAGRPSAPAPSSRPASIPAPTTNAARPAPRPTVRRVTESTDTTPPPPLRTHGTDYVAIARSLEAYRYWLLAHHPDVALASQIYVRGTTSYQKLVSNLDYLRARHQTLISIDQQLTFTPAKAVHGSLVTLRSTRRSPRTGCMLDRHHRVVRPRPFAGAQRLRHGHDLRCHWALAPCRHHPGRARPGDRPLRPVADRVPHRDRRSVVITTVLPDAGGLRTRRAATASSVAHHPELGASACVSVPGVAGSGHETYAAGDPNAPRPVFERAIPADNGEEAQPGCPTSASPPTGRAARSTCARQRLGVQHRALLHGVAADTSRRSAPCANRSTRRRPVPRLRRHRWRNHRRSARCGRPSGCRHRRSV